jgi:hypothetical protein
VNFAAAPGAFTVPEGVIAVSTDTGREGERVAGALSLAADEAVVIACD